jgi:hypothetical protein
VKVLVVSLLLGVFAVAGSATAARDGATTLTTFKTPGGLITCEMFVASRYSESLLRCDIRTGLKPHVKKPKGCHFDYGSTLELRPTGKAFAGCVSDAISPVKQTLAYGSSIRRGPFLCRSARAGLTCRNKQNKGFFLSKTRWKRV